MKVFWSWQSDRDQTLHHYFVRDALKDACKLIASDPDFEEAERPEVDHDMKNVAGTQDIASTILAKIASANVFVADMTPVAVTDPAVLQPGVAADKRSEPKYLQNPNVMSELGYAERAITQGRIVLVANAAHYPGPEALPFDWRHRSGAKTYKLANGATKTEIAAERKRFASILKDHILPILAAQASTKAAPPAIVWQPASDTDPAIWKGAEGNLQYRNASMGEPQRRVKISNGRRIFARIAPALWTPPPRSDLEPRISNIGLVIRSRDGDWGLNRDGALSVWGRIESDRNEMDVWNATQWFQATGELWAVNCNSFSEHNGRTFFSSAIPFGPLDEFLRNGIAAIREMGGKGPVGIKLGASDLSQTVLPGTYTSEQFEDVARQAAVEHETEHWTPAERREFLLRFWNELQDAYGRPPMSMVQFEDTAQMRPMEKS
ncbi:hypothetical protein RFN29_33370 [Mesorhizobium sp. VK22B]|uniref:Uncharacterized protein n=1 Tax=Mesorhizobium captivum TaxID=3072319 RepID=A0ABU4ZAW7_9HYPH|nr:MULTISPECIES: hypothetical protein [unclassified Mesorhizobium]MDX8496414.1 hypothetical protein [Mesorhizobium sp. VK22B]MDX8509924.1 hypothetical protein [Mesorhizobium sp. VK22E]